MSEYNLLSFSYPINFNNNDYLADAIALLIKNLDAKNVYLLGQSYGGLIAQIIAKKHPDVIKGMISSGTCGLGKNMNEEDIKLLNKMFDPKKIEKNIKKDKKLPICLLVPLFKIMASKVIKDKKIRKDFKDIIDICKPSMSKEYFVLMDTLLGDVLPYVNAETKEDFISFDNEVLIFFSKEDNIFNDSLKENLVNLMSNPLVEWDLKGGHLAMMISIGKYIETLNKFIREINLTNKIDFII